MKFFNSKERAKFSKCINSLFMYIHVKKYKTVIHEINKLIVTRYFNDWVPIDYINLEDKFHYPVDIIYPQLTNKHHICIDYLENQVLPLSLSNGNMFNINNDEHSADIVFSRYLPSYQEYIEKTHLMFVVFTTNQKCSCSIYKKHKCCEHTLWYNNKRSIFTIKENLEVHTKFSDDLIFEILDYLTIVPEKIHGYICPDCDTYYSE